MERVWWRKDAATMDPAALDSVLLTHMTLMRERLDQASALGQAAEACGTAGNIRAAIEIALEVEQLTYEVNTLLNAASLINRIART